MARVSVTRQINVRDPSVLPAWVPEPGTFKDISTNTLFQVRPTGWPTSESAGPFANWAGGVYCAGFGSDGGYAVYGSGHLSQGTPLWSGVWVFDLATLGWLGRNVPSQPLLENSTDYDQYGQSIVPATLGHPYTPHTYDGLVYQPTANGGGSDGSMIQLCSPGTPIAGAKRVLRFDLSSASDVPTRVIDNLAAASDSFPASCRDMTRGGFWVTSGTGQGTLSFVSFADWSVTAYPGVAFNSYGNTSLVYVPDRDCIVALSSGSGGVGTDVRVCPIVGGVPQGWALVVQAGSMPDARAGGVWSTILGCIVSYKGTDSYAADLSSGYVVHKLAVPSNLVSGTWSWTTETLTGVGGAVPQVTRDGNNNVLNNGSWSRFVEAPSARCFLFVGSINGPVQAWRLTGM